jgi:hypothetical protein
LVAVERIRARRGRVVLTGASRVTELQFGAVIVCRAFWAVLTVTQCIAELGITTVRIDCALRKRVVLAGII